MLCLFGFLLRFGPKTLVVLLFGESFSLPGLIYHGLSLCSVFCVLCVAFLWFLFLCSLALFSPLSFFPVLFVLFDSFAIYTLVIFLYMIALSRSLPTLCVFPLLLFFSLFAFCPAGEDGTVVLFLLLFVLLFLCVCLYNYSFYSFCYIL